MDIPIFGEACIDLSGSSFQQRSDDWKLSVINAVLRETKFTVSILMKDNRIDRFEGPFDSIEKVVEILNGDDGSEVDENGFCVINKDDLRLVGAKDDRLDSAGTSSLNGQNDESQSSKLDGSQTNSSEDLEIDESVWSYLLTHYSEDYQKICKKHSCNMHPKIVFAEDGRNQTLGKKLYLNVSSSSLSKQKRYDACEAFAQFYQRVFPDVEAQVVSFAEGLNIDEINDQLKQIKASLIQIQVYHPGLIYYVVSHPSNMKESKDIIEKSVNRNKKMIEQPVNKLQSMEAYPRPVKRDGELYICTFFNGLTVSIFRGDLVEQKVNVIVNPANVHLQHGSGAAAAIAKAAGKELTQEGRKYIRENGDLYTSQAMHTTAGNLWPSIQYVIHAAGPDARYVKDKGTCFNLLEATFRNCLEYANDKLTANSIAMPAISSGIYRVPKEDVARAAYAALVKFDQETNPSGRHLKEVYIVSLEAETINVIQARFKREIKSTMQGIPSKNAETSDDEEVGQASKRQRTLSPSEPVVNHEETSPSSNQQVLLKDSLFFI